VSRTRDQRWRQLVALSMVFLVLGLTTLGFCVAFLNGA
jgi:hypothetical protein